MAFALVFVLTVLFFALRGEFFVSDLSVLFFRMLFNSSVFALLQSALSVLLSFAFALLICWSFLRFSFLKKLEGLARSFSYLVFFAPSLVLSMAYLDLATQNDFIPSFGLFPIVFAHSMLNALFIAFLILSLFRKKFSDAGNSYFASVVFGVPAHVSLFELFRQDFCAFFKAWAPLVFWWSFSSFTTVLILGGGPKFSTPEVLMFYSYGAGDQSSRVFVLALVQALIGFGLYKFSKRKNASLLQKEFESSSLSSFQKSQSEERYFYAKSKVLNFASWLGLAAFVGVLIFWSSPVLMTVEFFDVSPLFSAASATSLRLLLHATFYFILWLALGFVSRGLIFKWSKVSLFFSPVLLAILFSELSLGLPMSDLSLNSLNGFVLFLTILPLGSFWLDSEYQNALSKNSELIQVLDLSWSLKFSKLLLPLMQSKVLVLFLMLCLLVLGDVGVTSILRVGRDPSLAMKVYQSVAIYDFSASFRLFSLLFLFILPFSVLMTFFKGRNFSR